MLICDFDYAGEGMALFELPDKESTWTFKSKSPATD